MDTTVLVPGGRDVRATLDAPRAFDTDHTDVGERVGDRAVVACPPHPQFGGSRTDSRLIAVSGTLVDREIACLRFDYGDWDEGRGEVADACRAVEWATKRFDRVGLFGFSFGGGVATLAAARTDVGTLSVLAPASRLDDDDPERDAVAAIDGVDRPVQVIYGERDDTADWAPLVDRIRDHGGVVEAFPADHFFIGQRSKVARLVAGFQADRL
jgi:alpha/beta superfamily hydrolase